MRLTSTSRRLRAGGRQDFVAKLAVLVPAPRAHLTKYHGVLGPAAVWRPLIVPTAAAAADDNSSEVRLNPQSPQPSPTPAVDAEPALHTLRSARHGNYTWAELMKRVFLV